MDVHEIAPSSAFARLAEESIAAVRRWRSAKDIAVPAREARLAELVRDPAGAAFALEVVNGVLRPQEARAVARNLVRLSHEVPDGIPWGAVFDTHVSAGIASLSASGAVPRVRERYLRLFSHFLLRLDVRELEEHLADLTRSGGIRPTLAPVTTSASGQLEANRQAADVRDLLLRDDVESVTFRVSAMAGNWRLVDLDGLVDDIASRVAPLFDIAAGAERAKVIDLEVGTFEELEPTLRVFERMANDFPTLVAGISLPDAFPDSLPALRRVAEIARRRSARGGEEVAVRITRGGFLPEERAVAESHGWQPAVFGSAAERSAQFVRMLDFALLPEQSSAFRVVSATHDLFLTAFAWRLARARGVERKLEHEFPLGLASRDVVAVKRDVGGVRILAPVMRSGQLPLAAPYLLRRLGDLASNAGDGVPPDEPAAARTRFLRDESAFRAALADSRRPAAASLRRQDFVRTEVADFTNPATREWALGVLERSRDSAAGEELLSRSVVADRSALEERISRAISLGQSWGERRGVTRATVLDSVGEVLAQWRGLLAEVAVSESRVRIEEADVDVTVAIELAARAAANARELDLVDGAKFSPPRLTVVVSPRSGALTSLAGLVLAALAAGSAVIIKTAPETRRCSAVFVETLVAGGVPPGLVTVLDSEGDVARALLSDERVDRVLHAGSRHAAKLFHSWSAEMALNSTTGGRNAVIVTPSADLESAVSDLVASAFDHAGQAPTATGTVILVGSVGSSARFLGRLADAVSSVSAGGSTAHPPGISALARPAGERELEALDELAEGETWKVRPRQLDEDGMLWSPGLRDGLRADSLLKRQERRAPVLDIVRAATLGEAIEIQNSTGFGLSAGIHSLDSDEVETWLESAEAGVLCVNRAVAARVGARVPVGGWNRAVLGTGRAAGGQDAAAVLGSWEPVAVRPGSTVTLEGVGERVATLVTAALPGLNFTEFDWVRAGAQSDEAAWSSTFAQRELAQLEFEKNVQRYRPIPVTIRLSEGASVSPLVRVLAAATIAGAPVVVSTATPLHPALIALFGEPYSPVDVAEVLVESDIRWRARAQAGEIVTARIRLIGGDADVLARVLHGQVGIAVHAGPVTTSGRIELLTFLREQSLCLGLAPMGATASNLESVHLG